MAEPPSSGGISGVVLPRLQVLYVHVELQCLHAYLRNQRLVEVVRQRHVADAEEGAVLYVILGVQIVDGMLGVQQWLGVAGPFAVPAVHALLHEVELAPVVVVPRAVNLIAALPHHVNGKLPVLVTQSEREAVGDVGGVGYQSSYGLPW